VIDSRKKHLLVEGNSDLYAIAKLMSKHTVWEEKKPYTVQIKDCGGVEKILEPKFISTELKSPEVEILGIVVDADNSSNARWDKLRTLCKPTFHSLPEIMPTTGFIEKNADEGKKLGIWIMPDNQSVGMMETFMHNLVTNQDEKVCWAHAQASTKEALKKGATYRPVHKDKANIYTWLAWQDEPGQTVGGALMQNILNAKAPYTVPFVNWFCELFELPKTSP